MSLVERVALETVTLGRYTYRRGVVRAAAMPDPWFSSWMRWPDGTWSCDEADPRRYWRVDAAVAHATGDADALAAALARYDPAPNGGLEIAEINRRYAHGLLDALREGADRGR